MGATLKLTSDRFFWLFGKRGRQPFLYRFGCSDAGLDENGRDVRAGYYYHRMSIASEFIVSLLTQVGGRHQDAELPVPET